MSDEEEKKKEELSPEDIAKLKEEIEAEGVRESADVFSLIAAEGVVIFVIKNPPGGGGKALAIQLPIPLAIELGGGLIQTAIVAGNLKEGEGEEKKEEKKITWH